MKHLKGLIYPSIVLMALLGCAREKPVVAPEGQPMIAKKAVEEPLIVPKPIKAPEALIPYSYVVKPGDWLSRIALAEYCDIDKWHRIYAWNQVRIGDNPDRILPYQELQLRRAGIENKERLFRVHAVEKGESLWSVAAAEYGDGRAWLLIFHDNRGVFVDGIGFIWPGMELRIRKAL